MFGTNLMIRLTPGSGQDWWIDLQHFTGYNIIQLNMRI